MVDQAHKSPPAVHSIRLPYDEEALRASRECLRRSRELLSDTASMVCNYHCERRGWRR